MPSNSLPRIEIPSKPLGYDALQIVHGCVLPRLVSTLRSSDTNVPGKPHALVALILSSRFFFRCRRMPSRTE